MKMVKRIALTMLFSIASHFVWVAERKDRVLIMDVGQGDAILVQSEGQNILIDGGPDAGVLFKLGDYIESVGNSLDMIILTHPHGDHIEGWLDIYRIYSDAVVVVNRAEYGRADWQTILRDESIVDSYNLLGRCLGSDGWLEIGALSELSEHSVLCFIYPLEYRISYSNINNGSVVNLLITPEKAFWFMGDAEKQVELEIIRSYSHIDLGDREVILKAGHHCSKTSSSSEWIEFISPDLVICSFGEDNKYGHPSLELLERLENMGIEVVMTKEVGDVIIEF